MTPQAGLTLALLLQRSRQRLEHIPTHNEIGAVRILTVTHADTLREPRNLNALPGGTLRRAG
ncbi:hypothetical protein GCM10023085_14660 [Actinomadura viridis]